MTQKHALKVIAQSVEDADLRDFLIFAGCDLAQGFCTPILCRQISSNPY